MATKRKAIKREDLARALKDLEEQLNIAPEPKAVVTAGEAVRELEPILRKLRRKGHSSAHISKVLEKAGVAIGSNTLNSYLRRTSTASKKKDSQQTGQTPAATPNPGAIQVTASSTSIASAPDKPHPEKQAQAGDGSPNSPALKKGAAAAGKA